MALAVLGCIAASATFAFGFGWTRGATDVHRWTYALAGVALDLLKAGLPIFGAVAWHESKPARALACWLVFVVLTGLSLWCAYGTTATQLAERFANQAVAACRGATLSCHQPRSPRRCLSPASSPRARRRHTDACSFPVVSGKSA